MSKGQVETTKGKTQYPSYYTEEMKGTYDDIVSHLQNQVGKEIGYNEEYLIDLSAKVTINKIFGCDNGMTDEEIEELRDKNTANMVREPVFTTPKCDFHDDVVNNPMLWSDEKIYDMVRIKPEIW